MNGFDLFAALSDVDEKFLAKPQVSRAAPTLGESAPEPEEAPAEDISSPRGDRGLGVLGTVAAACLCVGILTGALLYWVFTRPTDWGTQTGGTVGIHEPPEHTHGADLDEQPHIKLTLNGLEEYYALREKLALSDEDLTAFLTKKGYAVVGLTDRAQLVRLLDILETLPVPLLDGEEPRQILVDDRSAQVVFAFDDVYMEVQRQPSAATVERKTRQLSRVSEYENYPLYLGDISQAGGLVAAHYVLNVDDHAAELEVKAGSGEEALDLLKGLWFRYLSAAPKHGTYFRAGENPDNEMVPMLHINTQTGVFVASGGIAMSYAESGQYGLENGRLTATTQSATLVFAVLDSETLLLLDDGGIGLWLKEGDRYKWSSEFGS